MQDILVLGVAGGCVIRTLIDKIEFKGKITGVEIDHSIIEIANTYFQLDKIPNLEIILDDASKFVLKTNKKFDLIIIDVFQDATMPNFLFEFFFVNRVCELLNSKGQILFNTMILNDNHKKRNKDYIKNIDSNLYSITQHKIKGTNELIFIERKN